MKNIQTLTDKLYNYYFAVGYNSSSDSNQMPTDENESVLIDALREAGITMAQIHFVIMRAINDGENKAVWGDAKEEGFAL